MSADRMLTHSYVTYVTLRYAGIMDIMLKHASFLIDEYKVVSLTAEVEVGGDDEEIREDDCDADHEDKARLHESLQRGLLHAATLSSCIPPPALICFYPSPSSRSSRCQVLGPPRNLHWPTSLGSCASLPCHVLPSVSLLPSLLRLYTLG